MPWIELLSWGASALSPFLRGLDSKPTWGSLVAKVVGTQTCSLCYIHSQGEKANQLKAVMFQGCQFSFFYPNSTHQGWRSNRFLHLGAIPLIVLEAVGWNSDGIHPRTYVVLWLVSHTWPCHWLLLRSWLLTHNTCCVGYLHLVQLLAGANWVYVSDQSGGPIHLHSQTMLFSRISLRFI